MNISFGFGRKRSHAIQWGAALLTLVVLSTVGQLAAQQTPASAAAHKCDLAKLHKVLFLGNSITLHSPAPAIGWLGNCGMAASAADKDYVHLVTQGLAKRTGTAPETMVRNIADFERQYATYDIDANFKEPFGFGADLIILAIGENVSALKSEEAKAKFAASVTKLLQRLKAGGDPVIIVRSSFWPDPAKDKCLREACDKVGGIYINIGHLAQDSINYARSEREFKHAGVANHPGDRGMQGIADAILKAVDDNCVKKAKP